ncbi:MAG TPA: hypothetical protein VGV59_14180 [Pyrinomonadaceae bacterium]|nr:hypothetical protein [Pyrinomonadaceae bacterium]
MTSRLLAVSLAALCTVAGTLPVAAQTPSPAPSSPAQKSKPRQKTAPAPVPNAEANVAADPEAEARRTTAVLLVNSLADDAREFRDLTLRARVQAQVAELLWETESERARALFRRAWDAAVVADRENERRRDEEIAAQLKSRGNAVTADLPALRSEVLRAAARRDPKLGEEFLARMEEEKKREEEEAANKSGAGSTPTASNELPASLSHRLGFATELLQEGDTERALQFAAPALEYLTQQTISFLTLLRPKNAAVADRYYAALINRAAVDPTADANTVSLLATYAFTPGLFITASRSGGLSSQSSDMLPAPTLAPALRAAFFRVASAILLRPLPPPDQDRTTAGRFGTHFIAARLLPLFDQHSPDTAALLSARIANLAQELPENRRNPNRSFLTQGLVPGSPPAGSVAARAADDDTPGTLDEIERRLRPDMSADERDALYARAAIRAGARGDIRGRDFASKIADEDLRRQVRAYVDFDLVRGARSKGDAQETLRLAQTSEFQHLKRVWAYTEAAHLMAQTDAGRAVEILEAAGEEAHRIDPSDPNRPRAFVAIATRMAEVNRPRAWEVMSEVVKSANAAEAFTGADGHIVSIVRGKNFTNSTDPRIQTFDLTGLFRTLALDDLNRAVDLARSFTHESPRAVATIAAARAVLDKQRPRPAR